MSWEYKFLPSLTIFWPPYNLVNFHNLPVHFFIFPGVQVELYLISSQKIDMGTEQINSLQKLTTARPWCCGKASNKGLTNIDTDTIGLTFRFKFVNRELELMRSIKLRYIPVTAFFLQIDLFLDRISLKWHSRGSAMTNYKKLIDVTGPELPFSHKRKDILKID